MALKNRLLIFIILLGQSFLAVANETGSQFVKEPLVEMLAKQATNNIRFISNDGKLTYYQKRSGQLLLSSNYKVFEILKGSLSNHYTIIGTPARKKLVVLQNNNYHTFYSMRGLENIYIINFGQSFAREVGSGMAARLHNDDQWLSYYNPYNKIIYFEHTANTALKYQIKINARKNPYFVPQVVMYNEDQVAYTDMNEEGTIGLFLFKRSSGRSELKYKLTSPFSRLELCYTGNDLFIGEFGLPLTGPGSAIKKIKPLEFENFKNIETIYTSNLNDPGNMNCREKDFLYFSKNIGATNAKAIYEIVQFDITEKKEKVLTYFKSVTQLIDMDGVFLINEKGKTFIVKGNSNFKFIDILAAPNKGESL